MRIILTITVAVFSAVAVTAVFARSISNNVTRTRHLRAYTASGDLAAPNLNELVFVGSPLVWTQFYPPRDS